jgi:hypothetical protein
LASSAAKVTVKAAIAMRRRAVNVFMFIERIIFQMNGIIVENVCYLFAAIVRKNAEAMYTSFFLVR